MDFQDTPVFIDLIQFSDKRNHNSIKTLLLLSIKAILCLKLESLQKRKTQFLINS